VILFVVWHNSLCRRFLIIADTSWLLSEWIVIIRGVVVVIGDFYLSDGAILSSMCQASCSQEAIAGPHSRGSKDLQVQCPHTQTPKLKF
jgi:hypothetical protein